MARARYAHSCTTCACTWYICAARGASHRRSNVARMSVDQLASCRHGTCARYNSGCRCPQCRAANTARKRRQRARWSAATQPRDAFVAADVAYAFDNEPAPVPRSRDTAAFERTEPDLATMFPREHRRASAGTAAIVDKARGRSREPNNDGPGSSWLADLLAGVLDRRLGPKPATPPQPQTTPTVRDLPALPAAAGIDRTQVPNLRVVLGCGCAHPAEPGDMTGRIAWCQVHSTAVPVVRLERGG